MQHARLAARNLRLEKLPLVVTPHPLNDLGVEEVRALARAAYPAIIAHLTATGAIAEETRIDFVHPAERARHTANAAGANKP
ncbi:MAG: hypothetical protein IT531_11390 [Burkholderiales bacterium]|nr:hypothetical protein [Burkholderiales bacterium]